MGQRWDTARRDPFRRPKSPGTKTPPRKASADDSTGARLEVILREYMTRLERSAHLPSSPSLHTDELVKPMNLMVVTDGGEWFI